MFKLDNDFLISLGLGALPAEDKNKLLAHTYETLEMRVGMKLAEQMTDSQLDEFQQYIDRSDEQGALKWLETNFPNYKQVVAEELENLRQEIKTTAPQILASVGLPPPLENSVNPLTEQPPAQFTAQPQPSVYPQQAQQSFVQPVPQQQAVQPLAQEWQMPPQPVQQQYSQPEPVQQIINSNYTNPVQQPVQQFAQSTTSYQPPAMPQYSVHPVQSVPTSQQNYPVQNPIYTAPVTATTPTNVDYSVNSTTNPYLQQPGFTAQTSNLVQPQVPQDPTSGVQ
jgi:hypothetical protein